MLRGKGHWLVTLRIKAAIVLSIVCFGSYGQISNNKKDFHFENARFADILDSLSKKCGINFSYDADIPETKKVKSFQFTGSCEEAIKQLTQYENLDYKIIGNQIILFVSSTHDSIATAVSNPVEKFISIKGIVTDKKDKSPLSFAYITVAGKSLSTVSNTYGEFMIKVPLSFRNDSLIVSYIGYQGKSFVIDSLKTKLIPVELEERPVTLKPIFIKPLIVSELLKEVIAKIEINYLSKSASCTAFYRETTKEDEEYISVSEAVVDVSKTPYTSYSGDQGRLFKCRKSENLKKTKTLKYKLEGGIFNCLQIDIIKERISFLSPESFDLYNYTYYKTIPFNGMNLYVINFDQRENVELPLFKGSLYIEAESKTLVAAKFELSPRGIKYAMDILVKKQPRKFMVKPISAKYQVFYKQLNNRWILDYTRAELKIKAKSERFFFNSVFTSVAEMVITDVDTSTKVRFHRNEIIRSKDILDDYKGDYDENFWGNYNIIEPEEPIQEALRKLNISKSSDENKTFWQKMF